MVEHFKDAIRRYFDFRGRTSRPGYWYFVLATFLYYFFIGLLGVVMESSSSVIIGGLLRLIIILMIMALMLLFIPSISVTVRRLHDTGKSGWYYLFCLIPLVGGILLLVFLAQESEPHDNKWGPGPGDDHEDDLVDSLIGTNE